MELVPDRTIINHEASFPQREIEHLAVPSVYVGEAPCLNRMKPH